MTSSKKAPTKGRKPVAGTTAATETAGEEKVKPKTRAKAAVKPAQPKREPKADQDELVVFAIRLTRDERDAIHEAAGPARATRFVRALAIAGAHSDFDGVKRAIAEAAAAKEGRAKTAAKK